MMNYNNNIVNSKKGLLIVGLKSVSVDEEVIAQTQNCYDFKLIPNSNVIVLQVTGHSAFKKVKKIVGNTDCQYARQMEQKSINSRFYTSRNNSIMFTKNTDQARRMGFYFFAGRLNQVHKDNYEHFLEDPLKVSKSNSIVKIDFGAFRRKISGTDLPLGV